MRIRKSGSNRPHESGGQDKQVFHFKLPDDLLYTDSQK
jgi:hypothetical protein